MRLANINVVSLKLLGIVLIVFLIIMNVIFLNSVQNLILFGIIIVIIMPLIYKWHNYIILKNHNSVIENFKKTMELLMLKYYIDKNKFIVDKTKTNVYITQIFKFTVISFVLNDKSSQKELYLINTIVKYQNINIKQLNKK